MVRKRAMTWLVGAALLLPAVAFAQTAYTNRGVNMRAGPNQEFPLVTYLGAGVPVYVNGCVEGYTWCDVTANRERGWVYADYLSYGYNNQPVTIYSAGPQLGLPLISFSIGPYWDNYYNGRPWYGNRTYWYGRPTNWWYRPPPPRNYHPVVRPWPGYSGGNWDHYNRPPSWNNNNRPPNWNNHYNNPPHTRPPSTRPPQADRPPQANRPPQHAQPQPSVKPRVERPVTGEMDRSSKSQRTYTQQ